MALNTDNKYQKTINACFTGYVVQAIVNNFVPLLFLTFHSQLGVPMGKITFLVTFNFGIQLMIDYLSSKFVDRIGYRVSMIMADACAALGLILLAILPFVMPDPFAGILISVMVYAVGGGLTEVLISPIMEACPTSNKEAAMSLLHSFYCWGHVCVVLVSTLFFTVFGISNWPVMAVLWAIIPIINLISFTRVPIASLIEEGETGLTFRELAGSGIFWVLMLMMLCSGASEQAVSQWASTFAESGLGVSKTVGDLFGPMFFAALMGTSRAIYGRFGEKIDLGRFMRISVVLCLASYFLIIFVPNPVIGLIGCALVGFSVGIFWPGTFSLGSAGVRNGGTVMFALFALAGDIGCASGPTLAGMVSSAYKDNLRMGILAAVVFPFIMGISLIIYKRLISEKRS